MRTANPNIVSVNTATKSYIDKEHFDVIEFRNCMNDNYENDFKWTSSLHYFPIWRHLYQWHEVAMTNHVKLEIMLRACIISMDDFKRW